MLELKSLSLVSVVTFLEFQMFLIAAKVVLAFWILILMSASVPQLIDGTTEVTKRFHVLKWLPSKGD